LFALQNVEILYEQNVTEILGEEKVTGVTLKSTADGSEKHLELDGVFIAVGIQPNTDLVAELVSCENGYITAGEDCVTDCAGIFAAGDVRRKPLRQIVTAVADGANAVTSAVALLNKIDKKVSK
jgi:thioredoxin reductase (NADPH)